MNVDILNTTLEVSENPGLDMIDPRLHGHYHPCGEW